MKITANLPKELIDIEFPEIPDNASPDEIKEKITQVVRSKIKLERLLRQLQKVIKDYNNFLGKSSMSAADIEEVKKLIAFMESIDFNRS